MDVYAVVWDVSFEGGDVDSIWTTEQAANERRDALNRGGSGPFAVEVYQLDPEDGGRRKLF